MTNGELFIRENPTVETKINGSCVWIYFDGVNHYTMPTSWWEQEIGLFDKIKAEIKEAIWDDVVVSLDGTDETRIPSLTPDDVFEIIDKYRAERSEE